MKQFYVYIMTNQKRGTLYIGVTSDLVRRVYEHKNGLVDGFTKKYELHRLVYYEIVGCAEEAIQREKRLKKWRRASKIELIENANPEWEDLYSKVL